MGNFLTSPYLKFASSSGHNLTFFHICLSGTYSVFICLAKIHCKSLICCFVIWQDVVFNILWNYFFSFNLYLLDLNDHLMKWFILFIDSLQASYSYNNLVECNNNKFLWSTYIQYEVWYYTGIFKEYYLNNSNLY